MTLRFLLDTNVVSEWARPVPHKRVLAQLNLHAADCAICAVTLEELHFGVARLEEGARRHMLQRWLEGLAQSLPVLPIDAAAAQWLGQERARLAAAGRSASRTDGEIAAVAVTQGLVLVTHNTRDFRSFAGLQMEDWHAGA